MNFNRYRVVWRGGGVQGVDLPLPFVPVEAASLVEEVPWGGRHGCRSAVPVFCGACCALFSCARRACVAAPQKTSDPPHGWTLAVHQGDDLYTALGRAFHYSNNIAFEMMALSTTGRAKIRSAARDVLRVVQKNVPGVSWSGAVLKNASGLSSETRLSPMQCASMVRYMATTRVRGRFFLICCENGPSMKGMGRFMPKLER